MSQPPSDSGLIQIFSDERISVVYRPKDRIVHHTVHTPVFGEVFHEALLSGIEAMKKHGGGKWLSDDRRNGALLPDDLKWVDEVWYPKTVEAGWKTWALLPPTAVVGQLNIRRHIALWKERGITVNVFTDLGEALGWLETQ